MKTEAQIQEKIVTLSEKYREAVRQYQESRDDDDYAYLRKLLAELAQLHWTLG